MIKKTALFLLVSVWHVHAEQPQIAAGVTTYQDLFNSTMRAGVACYRIPSLITAVNGDLLAVMDERVPSCLDLHRNDDINIVMRRSCDDGVTWSEMVSIVNYPVGMSASDASMIVDRIAGTIFLFYNFMDLRKEPGAYYLHVIKSSDNGLSWSQAQDITSQITRPEWRNDFKFITSGRGVQTRSGLLLHTLVNLQNGLHLFGSCDLGNSWFLLEPPIEPADESKVMELADGRWMINSRVNGSGLRAVHLSPDGGKKWACRAESTLIDPGCNASLIRYTAIADGFAKNRLLFSNAKSATNRENMTVRISYDEGATWSAGKTIYAGASAYSSLTVLQNGDIGLLFEKDDYKENVFVRFSLAWLTDGADKLEMR
ncbi:exo-alpha-sialidase [candidate division KSB1 bacterium]|nr:exo-alpha-sialidase [candidate division KSB1 bacterium]RQW04607.1 MAG: exo-alpha-sialidase [candidate division KSB1 bacterium]